MASCEGRISSTSNHGASACRKPLQSVRSLEHHQAFTAVVYHLRQQRFMEYFLNAFMLPWSGANNRQQDLTQNMV
jgi:hypothetical protein